MKNKKIHILKVLLSIIVVIVCISLIIYLFPIIRNISTPQGQQEFKELIKNSGIKGVLLLCGLRITQIFLVILPGEPLEILA